MKRIFFAFSVLIPLFAFADIIVTRSSGNIEDVTVVSVTADEVTYQKNGSSRTLASSDVEGVLYDDGRYVSPPSKQVNQIVENSSTSNDSWAIDDSPNVNPEINQIADALASSPEFIASLDSIGLEVRHVQEQLYAGKSLQELNLLLWTDKNYSKSCRNAGLKAYYAVWEQVYQEAQKKAQHEGLKGKALTQKVITETSSSKAPIKAGNQAVLQCSGQ